MGLIAFYVTLTFFVFYGLCCLVIGGFVDEDVEEPIRYIIRCGMALYIPAGIIFLAWLWS